MSKQEKNTYEEGGDKTKVQQRRKEEQHTLLLHPLHEGLLLLLVIPLLQLLLRNSHHNPLLPLQHKLRVVRKLVSQHHLRVIQVARLPSRRALEEEGVVVPLSDVLELGDQLQNYEESKKKRMMRYDKEELQLAKLVSPGVASRYPISQNDLTQPATSVSVQFSSVQCSSVQFQCQFGFRLSSVSVQRRSSYPYRHLGIPDCLSIGDLGGLLGLRIGNRHLEDHTHSGPPLFLHNSTQGKKKTALGNKRMKESQKLSPRYL